jgi:probable addiction module antidote protein
MRSFKRPLIDALKNPEFAVHYLSDAVNERDLDGFLLAVRDVIEARGGMGRLASRVPHLHRVSLYKALSESGNPLFATMIEILHSLGIGLKPYLIDHVDTDAA